MSYTPKEYYRLYGRLEPAQIERLLDIAEAAQTAVDARNNLDEAIAGFPDEDFMSDMLAAYRETHNTTLIQGKFWMGRIEDEIKGAVQQAEYGMDELKKVREALEDLEEVLG
jgi:hypothetical protein